jgi:DNA helicase IV
MVGTIAHKKIIDFNDSFTDSGKAIEDLLTHIQEKAIQRNDLFIEIVNADIKEVSEKYFNHKNLLNSSYNDLESFDFNKFNILFRQYNQDLLDLDIDKYKKMVFREILRGTNTLPILLCGNNNRYWQLSGNTEMMGYKLFAISPCIKIINIQSPIL